MTMSDEKSTIRTLGIDLAKSSFHAFGADKFGKQILTKKFTRSRLKQFLINLPPCLIAMEACGSAHYWGRLLRTYGHEVKLIAPQFVKPYVKSNKSDAADAEAICEAAQRPNMRFVAIKSIEQQDIQGLHRMRSMAVGNRTALVNQIRGLLHEYGLQIPQGINHVRRKLPLILEDAENGLSGLFRQSLSNLYEQLVFLDEQVENYNCKIQKISQDSEQAKRLQTIPGVGPLVSTALIAAIGSIDAFKSGRELAAWLGLVPRQNSTGGKTTLLGISKRGDVYLRSLLIHGARSCIRWVDKKDDTRSQWAKSLVARRNKNIATVALANKIARTAYALLKNGEDYQVKLAV